MNTMCALFLVLGLFVVPGRLHAAAEHADHAVKADVVSAEAEEAVPADIAKPVEVGNKICPVGGEAVGTMGDIVKHEHNGKVYNLCCEMCIKDFDEDPAKYSTIAEDEVKG